MKQQILRWGMAVVAAPLFFSSVWANDSIPSTYTQGVPVERQESFFPRPEKWQPLQASFSVQSDMLFSRTKGDTYNSWRGNSYVSATLRNNYLELGTRFEELSAPLPGRSLIEQGRGIPHMYLTAYYGKMAEVTLGDFYDQFGSGTIFRAYEDRNLGIDNALRGARVAISPYKGITFKALTGQQRYNFDRTFKVFNPDRGFVSGTDLNLSAEEWFSGLRSRNMSLQLGGSFVTKQEKDADVLVSRDGKNYRLNLPEYVAAYGGRLRFGVGNFVLNGEYSYKLNDPTAENNYIYHPGSVAMLSASYSKSGMSVLLQAKRSENFNFMSQRSLLGMHLHVNHLPPFTAQHTYTLAALYPYATQPAGEWAFQGELRYKFGRKTALGGKYGTGVRLNVSHVRGLKKNYLQGVDPSVPTSMYGTDGYTSPFFGMGGLYYSDVNVEISKKVSSNYNFTFTYLHQIYNQEVVEGHVENPLQADPYIYSNIFIYDGTYKLSRKASLRTELQFLATKHAEGNWIYGLAEFSFLPNWMISVSDQYNMGTTKQHYYMVGATYTEGSHRVMLSYGRTRAGMNCSGGVCRWMPQTKGFYISYTGNF
ncbi:DUF6029 family protein [Porphyromonas gingivicanis]|uniref:DUF6029 family protein n=1 Tax=Porphyromonas gingivicanis TaxID=266762 RepID=UPI00046F9308|nr:DUF6029 family protein [Porphyromonas gingivicanis]